MLKDLARAIGENNATTPTTCPKSGLLGYALVAITRRVSQKGGAKAPRRIRRKIRKIKAKAKPKRNAPRRQNVAGPATTIAAISALDDE